MAKYTATDEAKRSPRYIVIDGIHGGWGGKFTKSSKGEKITLDQHKENAASDKYFDANPRALGGSKAIAKLTSETTTQSAGQQSNKNK